MLEPTGGEMCVSLNDVSSFHVRTNPRLQFVPFSAIGEAEHKVLKPLINSGHYAGILCEPGSSSLTMKSVSLEALRLFHKLANPCQVSDALLFVEQSANEATLVNLILDGVLEIADGSNYTSGANAYSVLIENAVAPSMGNRLSRLSMEAIEFCSRRATLSAIDLSWKLYYYNRLPVTPGLSRRLPDGRAVMRLLDRGGPGVRLRLDEKFAFIEESKPQTWLFWSDIESLANSSLSRRANFKLYISPTLTDTAQAFEAVVDLAPSSEILGFKIGANAHGLMRPDKLVVYFENPGGLQRFFEQCLTRLRGIIPHGVPFTSQLDGEGLFSSGMDPAVTGHLSGHSDDSWRIWVCNRLATAIREAHAAGFTGEHVVRYALVRLQLLGIDVVNWARNRSMEVEPKPWA